MLDKPVALATGVRQDSPSVLIRDAQPKASPHKRCRMRVFLTGATGFISSFLVP